MLLSDSIKFCCELMSKLASSWVSFWLGCCLRMQQTVWAEDCRAAYMEQSHIVLFCNGKTTTRPKTCVQTSFLNSRAKIYLLTVSFCWSGPLCHNLSSVLWSAAGTWHWHQVPEVDASQLSGVNEEHQWLHSAPPFRPPDVCQDLLYLSIILLWNRCVRTWGQ